jgi:excisionase family DNA binding protein
MRAIELTTDCEHPGIRPREATLAAARRYLSFLATEDIRRLPAEGLRDRLRKCRMLLAAAVETSHPREPLVRTVDEAAAALGISPLAVYRLINRGELAAYRISPRFIRIDETALRAFLALRLISPGGITGEDIPEQHIRPPWQ